MPVKVPRQQFVHAVNWMACDPFEDVTQICFRIEPVQLRRFDEAVDRGGPLPPVFEPSKVQLRRPRAIGLMARSAASGFQNGGCGLTDYGGQIRGQRWVLATLAHFG
jgi:hypothetical protein